MVNPSSKKVDIILFDGVFNPFNKFLKNKNYSIFYNRNEKLNLFVLLICILKLNISKNIILKLILNTQNQNSFNCY